MFNYEVAVPAADVDVVILSWNRVDDTVAAINSAANQKGLRVNVLVVDQGSELQSLETLRSSVRSLDNVYVEELGQNLGVAGGRNRATAMGSSPYVVALDSDAVFADDEVLSRVVREFDARPTLGAMAFRITNYFTHKNDGTSWDYAAGCAPDNRFSCSRFVGAGHAIRREVFEAVGGYDDRLFFCGEELDLCYRILNRGSDIEYMPEAEILHKVSPEHRVFWKRGRYYFTVRNNLYSSFKFGVSWPRLALAAAAFTVRGGFNGVGLEAVRGIRDAIQMGMQFDRRAPGNRSYRIEHSTWRKIRELEPWREQRWGSKLLRQFRHLPNQA
jgi:GT2 family glycosyltransferase